MISFGFVRKLGTQLYPLVNQPFSQDKHAINEFLKRASIFRHSQVSYCWSSIQWNHHFYWLNAHLVDQPLRIVMISSPHHVASGPINILFESIESIELVPFSGNQTIPTYGYFPMGSPKSSWVSILKSDGLDHRCWNFGTPRQFFVVPRATLVTRLQPNWAVHPGLQFRDHGHAEEVCDGAQIYDMSDMGMGQHLLSSIFSEMNIHKSVRYFDILGFTRGTRVPWAIAI